MIYTDALQTIIMLIGALILMGYGEWNSAEHSKPFPNQIKTSFEGFFRTWALQESIITHP